MFSLNYIYSIDLQHKTVGYLPEYLWGVVEWDSLILDLGDKLSASWSVQIIKFANSNFHLEI